MSKEPNALSLAEPQRAQRKTRYAGDQNSETDEFCSHFMPLQGRSNFTRRVCGFAGMNHSHIPAKNIPLISLSVLSASNDRREWAREKNLEVINVFHRNTQHCLL